MRTGRAMPSAQAGKAVADSKRAASIILPDRVIVVSSFAETPFNMGPHYIAKIRLATPAPSSVAPAVSECGEVHEKSQPARRGDRKI
jgi:hypothetical protein